MNNSGFIDFAVNGNRSETAIGIEVPLLEVDSIPGVNKQFNVQTWMLYNTTLINNNDLNKKHITHVTEIYPATGLYFNTSYE